MTHEDLQNKIGYLTGLVEGIVSKQGDIAKQVSNIDTKLGKLQVNAEGRLSVLETEVENMEDNVKKKTKWLSALVSVTIGVIFNAAMFIGRIVWL